MELSEGKLFTIEALNRIDGFEWPEWANYASMCCDGGYHWFWSDKPINNGEMFSVAGMVNAVLIGSNHPDWENSLITRAEFESVDGWVRNDGKSIPDVNVKSIIDVIFRSGHKTWFAVGYVEFSHTDNDGDIMKWRYRNKKKKQKQPIAKPDTSIETLISNYKAAKQSTLEARRLLEHAEAIEHNLLLSIEAWAESNGFDIRLLDESEENQELVITDWRDLHVGDVIDFTSCGLTSAEWRVSFTDGYIVLRKGSYGIYRVNEENDTFKFIRRPAKGEK